MGNCFSNPEYSNSTESMESVEKSYVKTSEGESGTKADLRGDVPYVDRDEPM